MQTRRLLGLLKDSWREIIFDTYQAWKHHRTIRLGAGLAYYGLFALVPVLSISVAVAGIFLSTVDIEETLTEVLGDIVDGDASEAAAAISNAVDTNSVVSGLGLIGLGSLLLAGSVVFVALQDAFDTVWEMPYRSGAGNTLRRRAIGFAVVLLSGAVMIASFTVNALSSLVRGLAPGDTALFETVADLLAVAGSWALVAAVLAGLFRFLTAAPLHTSLAITGGVVTALGLTVGNRLATEYLSRYGSSSLAGAAGSVLVGLFWVYAIAQVVLMGAEFTRTLELTVGPALAEKRPIATGPETDNG